MGWFSKDKNTSGDASKQLSQAKVRGVINSSKVNARKGGQHRAGGSNSKGMGKGHN